MEVLETRVPRANPTSFPDSLPTTREVEERDPDNEVGASGNYFFYSGFKLRKV